MYFNYSIIIRNLYHITLSVVTFPYLVFLSKTLFPGAAILNLKKESRVQKLSVRLREMQSILV